MPVLLTTAFFIVYIAWYRFIMYFHLFLGKFWIIVSMNSYKFHLVNFAGIWAGMHTVRYFDGKTYEWVGISRQPNIFGKVCFEPPICGITIVLKSCVAYKGNINILAVIIMVPW